MIRCGMEQKQYHDEKEGWGWKKCRQGVDAELQNGLNRLKRGKNRGLWSE